jgi:hypothetical protein
MLERGETEERPTLEVQALIERVERGTAGGWEVVNGAVRRLFDLGQGQFQPVTVGGAVLGSPTSTYECDLLNLLDQLGVASEFETFKLICKTNNDTMVGAILVPRRRPEKSAEQQLEVLLYLSAAAPAPRKGKRHDENVPRRVVIRLHPYTSSGSPFVTFNEMGDPAKFNGRLEIRIREAISIEG